jgi:hypothetical protein
MMFKFPHDNTQSALKTRTYSSDIEVRTTNEFRFSASPSRRSVKGVTTNGVTYEGIAKFIYLGTLISNGNSVEKEIQKCILAGSRTYFAAISLFRSRLLSRETKILLYRVFHDLWTLLQEVIS